MFSSALVVMFLCGWCVLSNLGNWDSKSFGQIVLALFVFVIACAIATCSAMA